MKHDRLSILRRQEAARLDQQKLDAFYTASTGRSTRFRDDCNYSVAVVDFEKVVAPVTIGVDMGDPKSDCTVVTGGYIQEHLTEPYRYIPTEWVTRAVKRGFQVGDRVRVMEANPGSSLKVGDIHTIFAVSPDGGQYVSVTVGDGPSWFPYRFELVEVVPAAPVTEQRYWVCVKAIGGSVAGTVIDALPGDNPHLGYWLPCDKDGWITHEPKVDSTCPVPQGLRCLTKLANGYLGYYTGWGLQDSPPYRIVAWKPVKS